MAGSENNHDGQVVVVGSGPCGAMAAAQLARRGADVLLLDAGLRAPRGLIVRVAGNTVFRWRQRSYVERSRHRGGAGVMWISARSLGGLSNYWTAAVPRFAPEDFTEGAAIDERYAWPIGYDDLAPYYPVAERELVVTAGPACSNIPPNETRFTTTVPPDWADVAARVHAGGENLCPMPMAKGTPWMIARRGTEFGSYHCVVAPLVSSHAIRLVRGAAVTRLNWSTARGRVASVSYVDRATGERHEAPARAVVVAAGAIDSTVLLLRSTSADFPDGLGNTRGIVGRYLHDHPREWWTASPERPMTALAHPLYISRAAVGATDPLMATSLTLGLSSPADRVRTWVRAKSSSFGVQVFGTMVPTPEVGVRLDDTADDLAGGADVRPEISLRYDDKTLANLTSARERIREVLAAGGLGVTVPGPFHDVTPGSSVHFGGSVRMHASPEHGAVDGWNRLYDAPNVVVCDSSCFTTGPEKNPTLTAMAIAARAADHLADMLASGHEAELAAP